MTTLGVPSSTGRMSTWKRCGAAVTTWVQRHGVTLRLRAHTALPSLLLPDLPRAVLQHEQGVGAVGDGEGEAVPGRGAAAVAVADAALLDVPHGEGAGWDRALPRAAALDQPVPGRLHHPERDGLHLCPDTEGQSWGHDRDSAQAPSLCCCSQAGLAQHIADSPEHCSVLSPLPKWLPTKQGTSHPTTGSAGLRQLHEHKSSPQSCSHSGQCVPHHFCQDGSTKNLWGRILAQQPDLLLQGK